MLSLFEGPEMVHECFDHEECALCHCATTAGLLVLDFILDQFLSLYLVEKRNSVVCIKIASMHGVSL